MSLVNDVLRDLDRRHAPSGELAGVPNEVRPLPLDAPRSRGLLRTIGVVVAAILVVMSVVAYDKLVALSIHLFPDPAPAVESPVVRPAAVPPAQSTGASPADAKTDGQDNPAALTTNVEIPVPPKASESDVTESPASGGDRVELKGLKLATEISFPPMVEPEKVAPAVKVAPVPSLAVAPRPPVVKPAAASPSAVPTPAAPAAPVIDSAPGDDWTKAQALIRSGNSDEAEPLLRRLLDSQPLAVQPRQAFIGLLLGARRYAEAIPVLKAGLARHPEQTAWAMNLARLYVDAGNYADAWDALSAGLPSAQQQPEYLAFAGTVLQRLERASDAVIQYQSALRLRPDEARWWVGLGIALEASNRSTEARAAYQRAKAIGGFSTEMTRFVDQKLQ